MEPILNRWFSDEEFFSMICEYISRCTLRKVDQRMWVLYLPEKHELTKVQRSVRRRMIAMGGKYSKKEVGFVFSDDPSKKLVKFKLYKDETKDEKPIMGDDIWGEIERIIKIPDHSEVLLPFWNDKAYQLVKKDTCIVTTITKHVDLPANINVINSTFEDSMTAAFANFILCILPKNKVFARYIEKTMKFMYMGVAYFLLPEKSLEDPDIIYLIKHENIEIINLYNRSGERMILLKKVKI